MKYITIRKKPEAGFYVVDTKQKFEDYCGWKPLNTFMTWLWYLGLPPKYAFAYLKLGKLFKSKPVVIEDQELSEPKI